MRRWAGSRMRRPRGVTLISLLVGLGISMLVILAALSLFQRMVKTTVDARQDAQSTAQRNASFLSAGLILQSAGFGIADAVWGTHGMVLKDLAWDAEHQRLTGQNSADGQGNAVVWSDRITGASQCWVLWAVQASGELRLFGPELCEDVTDWSSMNWHMARNVSKMLGAVVTMQEDVASCTPFGVNAAEVQQVRITLIAAKKVAPPNLQPVSKKESCTESQKTIGNSLFTVMCTSVCLTNLKPRSATP